MVLYINIELKSSRRVMHAVSLQLEAGDLVELGMRASSCFRVAGSACSAVGLRVFLPSGWLSLTLRGSFSDIRAQY